MKVSKFTESLFELVTRPMCVAFYNPDLTIELFFATVKRDSTQKIVTLATAYNIKFQADLVSTRKRGEGKEGCGFKEDVGILSQELKVPHVVDSRPYVCMEILAKTDIGGGALRCTNGMVKYSYDNAFSRWFKNIFWR